MTHPKIYQKLVAIQPNPDIRQACAIQETKLSAPQADEVLVKTHYTGVNAADYLMAQGRYLAPTPPPFDMGAESCGEVIAVGADVQTLKVGDAVLSIGDGGFCEYFTTKAQRAIPLPQASPEAVTLGISGLTASIALAEVGAMTQDETVLVTAAAGGTGNIAVQLAKIAGNHVIGTCGKDEKVDFLKQIGCDRPVNYRKESLRDVLDAEYDKGVDIVFEGVGGEMYDTAVDHLAVKGRLIIIGSISEYASGPQKVNRVRVSYKLIQKSASLRGFWLMHYFRQAGEHMQSLLSLVQDGKLRLAVDETSFTGVAGALDAIEHLYDGQNVGKVVVDFT
jgi:prostaglandin reductase 3